MGFVQVEPAPVTINELLLLVVVAPTRPKPKTTPPLLIVIELPQPLSPTATPAIKTPLIILLQTEPAPVTSAVLLLLPGRFPSEAPPIATPPSLIVKELPEPSSPISNSVVVTQTEPGPVTMTVLLLLNWYVPR